MNLPLTLRAWYTAQAKSTRTQTTAWLRPETLAAIRQEARAGETVDATLRRLLLLDPSPKHHKAGRPVTKGI